MPVTWCVNKQIIGMVLTVVVSCISPVLQASSVNVSGNVAAQVSSGNRMLDDVNDVNRSVAVLNVDAQVSGSLSAHVDGRHALSPYGASSWFNGLREAYADISAGDLDVRVGKQIIAWGRADMFNPTDNLTPRDYEILSSDDSDQRFGSMALQAQYYLTPQTTLTGVGLPAFRSSNLPSGLLPGNLVSGPEVMDYTREDLEWAVKLDKTGEQLDWSISYYRGFSLLPVVVTNTAFQPMLTNPRIDVLGADFAVAAGQWGLRGETAYVKMSSASLLFDTPPTSYYYTILGAERQVGWDVTVNVQWLYRHVDGYQDPGSAPLVLQPLVYGNAAVLNQFHRTQNGIATRISRSFVNDSLRAELRTVYYFEAADYAIRPKLSYAFDNHWTASVRADVYRGAAHSYFGYLEKNSLLMMEVKYAF